MAGGAARARTDVRIGLLGPVTVTRVRGGVVETVPPGGPGVQTVLGALAMRAGATVSLDELVAGLYPGDPPPSAREVIANCVYRLRAVLEPDRRRGRGGGLGAPSLIVTGGSGGYRLALSPAEVDALEFTALAAEAHTPGRAPAEALAVVERALGLWRGPTALSGLDAPLATAHRDALAEARTGLRELHGELMLAVDRHTELIPVVSAEVAAHPFRERLHAVLMLALYRSGRTADALAAYAHARRLLADELGVEPGRRLRDLHAAILSGDAAVLAPHEGVSGEASAKTLVRPSADEPRRTVAEPQVSRVPMQVPAAPADFTGRSGEVAEASDALTAGGGVVISGMGGIGKTSLALHAAHAAVQSGPDAPPRFPGGMLYASLREVDGPVDPGTVLDGWLSALGVPADRLPTGVPERLTLLRSVLADRAVLVVLDDAAGDEQVAPLLPATPGSAWIATSRGPLPSAPAAVRIRLGELSADESAELVTTIIGRGRAEEQPDQVAALASLCGHLPLALRIAAARLAGRPAWPVSSMVDRLADTTRLMGELKAGDLAVTGALEASFAQLTVHQAKALVTLAAVDPTGWRVPSAAAVLGLPEADAGRLLGELVDAALMQPRESGRYGIHELVAVHARDKARELLSEAELTAAVTNALDLLGAMMLGALVSVRPDIVRVVAPVLRCAARPGVTLGSDDEAAAAWVQRHQGVVISLARRAAATGDLRVIRLALDFLVLLPTLDDHLSLRPFAEATDALHRTSVDLFHRHGDTVVDGVGVDGVGMAGCAAQAAYIAGVTHLSSGEFGRARALLDESLALYGLDPDGDRPTDFDGDAGGHRHVLSLFCLHYGALTRRETGDHAGARAMFRRAVALVGELDGEARPDSLLALGGHLHELVVDAADPARSVPSERLIERARHFAGVFRTADPRLSAIAAMTEADLLCRSGDLPAGIAAYGGVLERAGERGMLSLSIPVRYRLAGALTAGGRHEAAVQEARRAWQDASASGQPHHAARARFAYGRALEAAGSAEAYDHLAEARRRLAALGIDPGGDTAGREGGRQ
ncbi:AfsR/SARP family transcriptional regulator [Spirillospora sp. NPDC052269]